MIQFDRKQLKNYISNLSNRQRDELKEFIHDNESLIDTRDFRTLYDKIDYLYPFSPYDLTALLLLSDIDPLSYVNEIPSKCFLCLPITSIAIPKGITSIGELAFNNCEKLTSINIPKGITSIGDYAFKGCKSLTSIDIPEGVTEIEFRTFDSCISLSSVVIPQGVTEIGSSAFENCKKLTSIMIPDSVTKIRSDAFRWTSLRNVTIPKSVTEIESYAFRNCENLKNITIPKSVSYFENYAFESCKNLLSINYIGTKQDWMNTTKGRYWRSESPIEKIICSDGEIKLRKL